MPCGATLEPVVPELVPEPLIPELPDVPPLLVPLVSLLLLVLPLPMPLPVVPVAGLASAPAVEPGVLAPSRTTCRPATRP